MIMRISLRAAWKAKGEFLKTSGRHPSHLSSKQRALTRCVWTGSVRRYADSQYKETTHNNSKSFHLLISAQKNKHAIFPAREAIVADKHPNPTNEGNRTRNIRDRQRTYKRTTMTEPEQPQPGTPQRPRPGVGADIMSRQRTAPRENRTPGRAKHKPPATANDDVHTIPPNPSPSLHVDTDDHDLYADNDNDENDDIASLASMTPQSMRGWENASFDDQSVHTLETAWAEMRNQDHHPFGTVNDARPILPKIAFCMGDIRDGLAMIYMQSVLLMSQHFTQKEIGALLFAFGISQVVFMAPGGFIMDKLSGSQKLHLVVAAGTMCSIITVLTAILAGNRSMKTQFILKVLQGACTAIQPPGLNSITLGIVGAPGFTRQVARNTMMRHIGSAINVGLGSLLAYFLYPSVGPLFVVSPLFCVGLVYYVRRIKPEQIDTDAARALIEHSSTMDEYALADATGEALWKALQEKRMAEANNLEMAYNGTSSVGDCITLGGSFRTPNTSPSEYVPPSTEEMETPVTSSAFNFGPKSYHEPRRRSIESEIDWDETPQAYNLSKRQRDGTPDVDNTTLGVSQTPALGFHATASEHIFEASEAIREAINPIVAIFSRDVLMFCGIVFGFHLSNSAVLPLVMRQVQLYDAQSSVLLSGLCILLAQSIMMIMSKLVGDYSPYWGRKKLFLICLFSLPVRCFILSTLTTEEDRVASALGRHICKVLILSTQLFDAIGAGIFGTLYVLITNDLSRGTGRFSFLLGIVSAFMCLGCTFSSAIGAVLAEDFGVDIALNVLGLISLVPAFVCMFHFPETLIQPRRRKKKKRRQRIANLLMALRSGNNPFASRTSQEALRPQKQFELV